MKLSTSDDPNKTMTMRRNTAIAFGCLAAVLVVAVSVSIARQQATGRKCIAFAEMYKARYEADPPVSSCTSCTTPERLVPMATQWCTEGKFKEAKRLVDTAAMICWLSDGCAKLNPSR